jgi:hypothetical protein
MREFIVRLIQLGASLPRDALNRIIDIDPLIDQMTEGEHSETLCENVEATFQAGMHWPRDFYFVNLVINARTVCHIKSILCLISNLHCVVSPVLLTLRENTIVIAE